MSSGRATVVDQRAILAELAAVEAERRRINRDMVAGYIEVAAEDGSNARERQAYTESAARRDVDALRAATLDVVRAALCAEGPRPLELIATMEERPDRPPRLRPRRRGKRPWQRRGADGLNDRHHAVMAPLCEGYSLYEVCLQAGLSREAARSTLKEVYAVLGVHTRREAIQCYGERYLGWAPLGRGGRRDGVA